MQSETYFFFMSETLQVITLILLMFKFLLIVSGQQLIYIFQQLTLLLSSYDCHTTKGHMCVCVGGGVL